MRIECCVCVVFTVVSFSLFTQTEEAHQISTLSEAGERRTENRGSLGVFLINI